MSGLELTPLIPVAAAIIGELLPQMVGGYNAHKHSKISKTEPQRRHNDDHNYDCHTDLYALQESYSFVSEYLSGSSLTGSDDEQDLELLPSRSFDWDEEEEMRDLPCEGSIEVELRDS